VGQTASRRTGFNRHLKLNNPLKNPLNTAKPLKDKGLIQVFKFLSVLSEFLHKRDKGREKGNIPTPPKNHAVHNTTTQPPEGFKFPSHYSHLKLNGKLKNPLKTANPCGTKL
jgi:hypothetical protein